MKIRFEKVETDTNSSFRLLHNPRLNDLFYWHFHPEVELVYIEGANGTRHVGNHISKYKESDLVLIGANMPHLNFDYQVQTNYKKEVLQILPSFIDTIFKEVKELSSIYSLLEKAPYGLAFYGGTKERVGASLQELQGMEPFNQFLKILSILHDLAHSTEYTLLHENPFVNKQRSKQEERMGKIYAYLDLHYSDRIELEEIANICNLSKPAFCRYFKKYSGITFISFLNHYRISHAKRGLLMGKNVSESCFSSGFESLSYFNRVFKKITNTTATQFKKRLL